MPSRRLTLALALASIVALAMVAAVGPAVFGPQAVTPVVQSPAPAAQVSPIASAPATPAPAADPSATPSTIPTLPPLVLASTPPDHEIHPLRTPGYPMPGAEPSPGREPDGSPPGSAPTALPPGSSGAVASRVVFSSLKIDLPIVSGTHRVRGNRGNYPLCDVAQYLELFVQPGEEGTTYIYAHAQRGMFLPMLRASRRNNGREMLGQRVEVYSSDARLYVYEVTRVKRHSTDLNIGFNVPRGEQRLILQTSEGPHGHRPVLQVQAELVSVEDSTAGRALPTPRPRVCLPPR